MSSQMVVRPSNETPSLDSAVLCANATSGHLKHQPTRFKGFQLGTLPSEMDQPDIVSSSLKMLQAALNMERQQIKSRASSSAARNIGAFGLNLRCFDASAASEGNEVGLAPSARAIRRTERGAVAIAAEVGSLAAGNALLNSAPEDCALMHVRDITVGGRSQEPAVQRHRARRIDCRGWRNWRTRPSASSGSRGRSTSRG
jgi:hypothetical protein